jgi:hypothetical protein
LHGCGFANALAQIGLPENSKFAALVLFNLGVEAGQILVVAMLVPVLLAVRHYALRYRPQIYQATSTCLGAASIYWLCERLFI